MKMIANLAKMVSVLLLLLISGLSVFNYFSGNSFERSFGEIKTGMSNSRVVEILGKPQAIRYSSDSLMYEYDYSSGVIGKSTEPSVVFDTTNKVVHSWYGD